MRACTSASILALFAALAVAPGLVSAQTAADVPALPDTIPLFPLPDVTLLPNTTQPFYIFEPRYRAMVADALASDSIIGMVALRPGFEVDYEGRPDVYEVGCVGIIIASEELPDGRYDILLRGVGRFRILGENDTQPYRLAAVEERPEARSADVTLLRARRAQLQQAILSAYPGAQLPPASLSDEEAINLLSLGVPLDPAQRQQLLEAHGPAERASALIRFLQAGVSA